MFAMRHVLNSLFAFLVLVTGCPFPGNGKDDTGECTPDREVCDGLDNDCDGEVDEDNPMELIMGCFDSDGDGFGNPNEPSEYCFPNVVADCSDCNDANAIIYPGAPIPLCMGDQDFDCDGEIEEEDCVRDNDGDGWYGDTDCDDANPDIHPEAAEYCNERDDDCDGEVDESDAVDAVTYCGDADGDGYGNPNYSVTSCDQPEGFVTDCTDCDDANRQVNPGEDDPGYDKLDQDCDGEED